MKIAMVELEDFISRLGEVERFYSYNSDSRDSLKTKVLSLCDFRDNFPKLSEVELSIVSSLKAHPASTPILLSTIHSDILSIQEKYKEREFDLKNLNPSGLWDRDLKYCKEKLNSQKDKVYELSVEKREAQQKLNRAERENLPKEELYPYELRLDRVDKEYKEEKVKLDNLFKEERAITIEMNCAGYNLFENIVKLCRGLLPVISKYLPKAEEKEVSSQAPTQNNHPQQPPIIYIIRNLSNELHNLCNQRLFEEISSNDFFNAINGYGKIGELKIKGGKREWVYYLINELKKVIDPENRKEWLDKIIKVLNISEKVLNSKYTVVKNSNKEQHTEYRDAIAEIISRYEIKNPV